MCMAYLTFSILGINPSTEFALLRVLWFVFSYWYWERRCSYTGIVFPVWKKVCCHLARLLLLSHVECSKAPFLDLFYCTCSRWALLLENMASHFTFMQMTPKSTWNPWKQTTPTVLSTCLVVSRTLKLGWPWPSWIFLKIRPQLQCLDPVVAPDAPLVLESHIWKPYNITDPIVKNDHNLSMDQQILKSSFFSIPDFSKGQTFSYF